jgi:hypothetical protein
MAIAPTVMESANAAAATVVAVMAMGQQLWRLL